MVEVLKTTGPVSQFRSHMANMFSHEVNLGDITQYNKSLGTMNLQNYSLYKLTIEEEKKRNYSFLNLRLIMAEIHNFRI